MRRVALMLGLALLLWACTENTSTTTVAPTTTVTSTSSAPSTTTTTVSTTSTSAVIEWPGVEILATNDDGVFYIDSAGKVTQLVKGPVAYAVDDTRGGLLFQVERGRSPMWWGGEPRVKSTEVWWVPQGASEAQALLVPTPGLPLDLSLIDVFDAHGNTWVMYVRHDSTLDPEYGPYGSYDTLRVFDLDAGEVTELFTFPGYEHTYEFSTGGGLTLADEQSLGGTCCYFLDIALSDEASVPVVPQLEDCWELEDHCPWRCVLSPEGTAVAYLDGDNASVEDQVVKVVDISSGEVTVEVPGTATSLDLGDEYLLVRHETGRSLLVRFTDPAQRHEVPVPGTARFVTAPVDIDAPVVTPTLAAIQLRADGLGVVDFGESVDSVMAVVAELLGPPDWDEIQISADADRSVRWDNPFLYLQFTYWDYFDAAPDPPEPMPEGPVFHYYLTESNLLATEAGITVGSTVGELAAAYPDVRFDRDCGGESWLFVVDPPDGWLALPIFGLLDGDFEDAATRIIHIGAGWDRTPC